ncbi:unnamed protein product, partial [Meganyctiphanes norvegica]
QLLYILYFKQISMAHLHADVLELRFQSMCNYIIQAWGDKERQKDTFAIQCLCEIECYCMSARGVYSSLSSPLRGRGQEKIILKTGKGKKRGKKRKKEKKKKRKEEKKSKKGKKRKKSLF